MFPKWILVPFFALVSGPVVMAGGRTWWVDPNTGTQYSIGASGNDAQVYIESHPEKWVPVGVNTLPPLLVEEAIFQGALSTGGEEKELSLVLFKRLRTRTVKSSKDAEEISPARYYQSKDFKWEEIEPVDREIDLRRLVVNKKETIWIEDKPSGTPVNIYCERNGKWHSIGSISWEPLQKITSDDELLSQQFLTSLGVVDKVVRREISFHQPKICASKS